MHNEQISHAMHEYGSFIEQMQQAISTLDYLAKDVVNDTETSQRASSGSSNMSQQVKMVVDDFRLH